MRLLPWMEVKLVHVSLIPDNDVKESVLLFYARIWPGVLSLAKGGCA